MKTNFKTLIPKASWLGGVKCAAIVLLLMLLSTTTTAWAQSGKTGKLSWLVNSQTGLLTISGKSTMPSYRDYDKEPGTGGQAPWYKYKNKIKHIKIVNGVPNIGEYAFYGLENVKSISIPSSVTAIGLKAFTNVGSKAPKGCTFTFTSNSQLTAIGQSAFDNFNGNVNLRNCTALKTINYYTFSGYGAHTITLPESLTGIAKNGFYGVDENVKIQYHLSGNQVLYVNNSFCAFASETKDVDITKHMYISGKYDEANFTQISLDGKSMTFDETNQCIIISDEQGLIDLGTISNDNRLKNFGGITFKLTADLDFSNMPLDEYNCNFKPIRKFGGHFDGQGHTIKGLTRLATSSVHSVGLFSNVINGGTIENVVLINPKMRGGIFIGGIAGQATLNSTIRNCAVINPSITGDEEVGVIVGDPDYTTTVSNCVYDANAGLPICGDDYIDGGGNKAVYHLNLDHGITSDALTFGDFTVSPQGANVKLTLNRPGYDFVGFKSNEVSIKNGQFTMPAKNVSATAGWEAQENISVKASQVNDLYWTTFYCGDAGYYILEDEEAFAYTATVHDDEIILHSLGKYIPKGSAVIIAAEDNSISMKRNDYGYPDFSVDNDLKGVDWPTARTSLTSNDSYTLYMLSNKNNHFGFHHFAGTNVPARKAYFTIPASAAAREFTMVFDDEATAICDLRKANAESPLYDLNGRVVSGKSLKPGVYVKNGKKFVVK